MPKCKSEFEDWLLSLQQLFSRCLSLAFFEFKTGFFPSTASSLHSGQKENSWPASASFIPALELGRIAWNYQDRLKINHHINKHHKHHNNKKTKKTPQTSKQRQKIPTKKWRKKTSNRQETFVKLYCNTLQLLKLLPFNRRPDKFMKKQSTNAYMETL